MLEGIVHSGGPPLHVHVAEDEVVIVLEGELDFQVGEERGILTAGGLLWFPRRIRHAVANLADVPCRFITVVLQAESRTSSAHNVTTSRRSPPALLPTQRS